MIQTQLIGSGHVECAVVLRRKDGSVKAVSLGYQPSIELLQAITTAMRDPSSAREHGIQFNGASHTCIRADQWAIYAKKVSDCYLVSLVSLLAYVEIRRFCSSGEWKTDCVW